MYTAVFVGLVIAALVVAVRFRRRFKSEEMQLLDLSQPKLVDLSGATLIILDEEQSRLTNLDEERRRLRRLFD